MKIEHIDSWLAAAGPGWGFGKVWEFFAVGGIFMGPLVFTSVVAVAAIVYKARSLRRAWLVPPELERQLDMLGSRSASQETLAAVARAAKERRSSLARLCGVALGHPTGEPEAVTQAVEASAREEILRMQVGLSLLDVVITVAPMLGLLGTASGLVIIFGGLGESSDYVLITKGIAQALNTTIVGLAVALPCVVAHSYFDRRIERFIARMEVLTGKLVSFLRDGRSTDG